MYNSKFTKLMTTITIIVAIFFGFTSFGANTPVYAAPGDNTTTQQNAEQNGDNGQQNSDDATTSSEEDTCESTLHGFGWIFCPGRSMVTDLINVLSNGISDLMNWTLLANNSDTIIPIWQSFLGIANVIFAAIFVVIVICTALSIGPLSNYDVKSMIPRLVGSAIAVNLSFYICAALADISTIAGKGIYKLLTDQISSGAATNSLLVGTQNALAGIADLGVAAVMVVIFGGTVLIAIIVILLAIAFRQVALLVLTVFSPIIFALYVLPNTQKTAAKVFDFFVRLLIVYPMFMAVWGGAQLVSNIVARAEAGASGWMLSLITTAACGIAPAFAIIPLFNASGGLMKTAMSVANKPQKAASGMINDIERRSGTRRAVEWAGKHANNPLVGAVRNSTLANKILSENDAFDYQSKIDESTLKSASNWAKSLNSDQIKQVATTGQYVAGKKRNGEDKVVVVGDTYRLRAAAKEYGGSMSAEEAFNAMTFANNRAKWLESHGRRTEADQIRNEYANAIKDNPKLAVGKGAVTSWGGNGASSEAWHNNFSEKYDEAVAAKITGMSAKEMAATPVATRQQMRDSLNSGEIRAQATGNDSGKAKFAEARQRLRDDNKAIQAQTKEGNKLRNNAMKGNAENIRQMDEWAKEGQMKVRTSDQQRAANYFNLDETYRRMNSGDKALQEDAIHHVTEHILTDPNYEQYAQNMTPQDQANIQKIRDAAEQPAATRKYPHVDEWKIH